MAVKIVRQAKKIALLGAPTSAAAMSAGHEEAPSALRKAGLATRLTSIGYEVNDLGDDPTQVYEPDEESPRARNLPAVVRALEALKPRVEQAVKSCALPVILSGDCSVALAVVAGARRYYRHVSLLYMDRHADLNTPATTPSGCVDGMVVSHLTGRGAAELVRFWGEPPLVREPDLALFGVDCLDPSEEEALRQSPLRSFTADEIKRMGAAAAAKLALERIHAGVSEFVLHLDVDVIADFRATNYPASGGLTPDDVRESLNVFVQQKSLAAIEVTAYNPSKDPDGSAAKAVIDLIADALEKRLQTLSVAPPEAVSAQAPAGAPAQAGQEPDAPPVEVAGRDEEPLPEIRTGEAWSSDSLEGAENSEKQGETSESSTLPTASDENRTEPAQPSELSSGEPQSLEPAVTPGEETSESQEQSDETTA